MSIDCARSLATLCTGVALAIGLGLGATSLSAETLLTVLERRFPRTDIGNGKDIAGVIALGDNPQRVQKAVRLGRLYPHLKIIVPGTGSQSEVLSTIGSNIEPDRVLAEEAARNTYENATLSSRMIGTTRDHWLLVTSASHMPRAVGTFRKAGVHVVAWPIFDLTQPGNSIEGVVRHETLGLLAYWVLGRSEAPWPGSASSLAASTSTARAQALLRRGKS